METSCSPQQCNETAGEEGCAATITLTEGEALMASEILTMDKTGELDAMLVQLQLNLSSQDGSPKVNFSCSATPWSMHIKTFYRVPQYVGALIILSGWWMMDDG